MPQAAVAQMIEQRTCNAKVGGLTPSGGTILSAHQPSYFPWLGLFDKIKRAHKFCVFDGVQFERKGYSNRVKIKTHQGPQWLTVPVEHGQPLLKDAKIIQNGWQRKHLKTIELAYRKAPYFDDYFPAVEAIILSPCERLSQLCNASTELGCALLGIDTPIVYASDYDFKGEKSDLVLDMCKQLGATEYIFGSQGRDYADIDSFTAAGIKVHFQDYHHPAYPQLYGDFVPGLSCLDSLFNAGPLI